MPCLPLELWALVLSLCNNRSLLALRATERALRTLVDTQGWRNGRSVRVLAKRRVLTPPPRPLPGLVTNARHVTLGVGRAVTATSEDVALLGRTTCLRVALDVSARLTIHERLDNVEILKLVLLSKATCAIYGEMPRLRMLQVHLAHGAHFEVSHATLLPYVTHVVLHVASVDDIRHAPLMVQNYALVLETRGELAAAFEKLKRNLVRHLDVICRAGTTFDDRAALALRVEPPPPHQQVAVHIDWSDKPLRYNHETKSWTK
ncbi:MAG TPA: hypothetical protein VLD39_06940 [Gammaproteobacteria bacterium]|nr:hypothetical protein [Gammaproteobacteria bacterium]